MADARSRELHADGGARPAMSSVEESAEALGVSVSTVWRMIRRGDLASVRLRGRRLIPREALEARVESRQSEGLVPFSEAHPIFRLVGAGRSGGREPGARDKHAILDR